MQYICNGPLIFDIPEIILYFNDIFQYKILLSSS